MYVSVDVPKVWIMGQVMSLPLEPIVEEDESEDSQGRILSPAVPARIGETTAFPYLTRFCKQSGSVTLSYLLEMMLLDEEEASSVTPDDRALYTIKEEELLSTSPDSSQGLGIALLL